MWAKGIFSRLQKQAKAQANKKNVEPSTIPTFHLRRIPAEIKLLDQLIGHPPMMIPARILSSDLSPFSVRLMTPKPIGSFYNVSVNIMDNGNDFYVRGRVNWCKSMSVRQNIITKVPFLYRVEIEFAFDTREEMQNTRAFVQAFNRRNIEGIVVDQIFPSR